MTEVMHLHDQSWTSVTLVMEAAEECGGTLSCPRNVDALQQLPNPRAHLQQRKMWQRKMWHFPQRCAKWKTELLGAEDSQQSIAKWEAQVQRLCEKVTHEKSKTQEKF